MPITADYKRAKSAQVDQNAETELPELHQAYMCHSLPMHLNCSMTYRAKCHLVLRSFFNSFRTSRKLNLSFKYKTIPFAKDKIKLFVCQITKACVGVKAEALLYFGLLYCLTD
jgi:hypothetical protein